MSRMVFWNVSLFVYSADTDVESWLDCAVVYEDKAIRVRKSRAECMAMGISEECSSTQKRTDCKKAE